MKFENYFGLRPDEHEKDVTAMGYETENKYDYYDVENEDENEDQD